MVQFGAVTTSTDIFPLSATDDGIVRWNGTGGQTMQSSGVTIDDSNNVCVPAGACLCAGGTSYCACIGDTGTAAGIFCDTGSCACLACSSTAGVFCTSSKCGCLATSGEAGFFCDGSRCACLATGSIAGVFCDGTQEACLVTGTCAGIFCCSGASISVSLVDGSFGVCACGCCIATDNCMDASSGFFCGGNGGFTGTFTNGDAATVTVCGGVIASVV